MNRLIKYRRIIDKSMTKRDILREQLQDKYKVIKENENYIESIVTARWVLSEATKLTQQKFSGYLESLVTKALTAVFDRPFRFIVDFQLKRNKSECYFYVQDGDKDPEVPKTEMGGGCLDVISVALRIALWSLQKPRSCDVLILDEPMKFVGKGLLLNNAVKMLKEISHKLGFQLIIVTHEIAALSEIADKTFIVTHNGIHSIVESTNLIYK